MKLTGKNNKIIPIKKSAVKEEISTLTADNFI